MLNSVDRKIIIRTIILYALVMFLLIYGFKLFNSIPIINDNPQIKAITAILLVAAISYIKIPTEFKFLICGVLGSFLMGISLTKYGEFLYTEASSSSIFLTIVSGAVVASLSRGDLIDAVSNLDKNKDGERYFDLLHQISVFCLFERLQSFIKRVQKKSKIIAGLLLLLQNIMLFVSSVVAVSSFSKMFKGGKKVSSEENKYINAGILCMCVSGCLLLFFFMKSPWWLFFLGFSKDLNAKITIPAAALIYGLFSFLHGYYLLSRADKYSLTQKEENNKIHPLSQRNFLIYIGLIIVFLIFTTPTIIKYILLANSNSSSTDLSIQKVVDLMKYNLCSMSDLINIGITTILILTLAAIILATAITRNIMQKTYMVKEKNNTILGLRQLMLGDLKSDLGIKSVISLVISMATLLAFRDMIKTCVSSATKVSQHINKISVKGFINEQNALALLGCLITLIVVYAIGQILGSNFGSFSIGLIIFSIISQKITALNAEIWQRWILEGAIIVSTYCNQVSPASANAVTLTVGTDEIPRDIQKNAWKVKSLFNMSALRVQMLAMITCVVISLFLSALGIR